MRLGRQARWAHPKLLHQSRPLNNCPCSESQTVNKWAWLRARELYRQNTGFGPGAVACHPSPLPQARPEPPKPALHASPLRTVHRGRCRPSGPGAWGSACPGRARATGAGSRTTATSRSPPPAAADACARGEPHRLARRRGSRRGLGRERPLQTTAQPCGKPDRACGGPGTSARMPRGACFGSTQHRTSNGNSPSRAPAADRGPRGKTGRGRTWQAPRSDAHAAISTLHTCRATDSSQQPCHGLCWMKGTTKTQRG